jgi:hypothetical protein
VFRRDVLQELNGLGADPVADGALVEATAPAPHFKGLRVGQELVDVDESRTFCHFNIFSRLFQGFFWIGSFDLVSVGGFIN